MGYRYRRVCDLFMVSGGWHHMKTLRHSAPFALLILLSILLTACGGMMDQGGQAGTNTQNTNNSANQKTNQNMDNGTTANNGMSDNNGNMDNGNMQAIMVTPDTNGNTMA